MYGQSAKRTNIGDAECLKIIDNIDKEIDIQANLVLTNKKANSIKLKKLKDELIECTSYSLLMSNLSNVVAWHELIDVINLEIPGNTSTFTNPDKSPNTVSYITIQKKILQGEDMLKLINERRTQKGLQKIPSDIFSNKLSKFKDLYINAIKDYGITVTNKDATIREFSMLQSKENSNLVFDNAIYDFGEVDRKTDSVIGYVNVTNKGNIPYFIYNILPNKNTTVYISDNTNEWYRFYSLENAKKISIIPGKSVKLKIVYVFENRGALNSLKMDFTRSINIYSEMGGKMYKNTLSIKGVV
jgi:hypothetical protein